MFRTLPVDRINASLSPDWTLNDSQVIESREKYGPNNIGEKRSRFWWSLAKDTILDPMIWFLLIASILFALLEKYSEATILLLAIIPISGMDAFLHWRTQISTRALSSRLMTFAHVIRNGKESKIPTIEIVPGDLITIHAGEYFAADGLIVSAQDVQVDESSLTGESFPVSKKVLSKLPKEESTPLVDYVNWGFVGTRVLTGSALLRVVFTGKETLYGEILESVLRTHQDKTPLQKAIAKLVLILIVVAIVFCGILSIVRYYQGFGIIDALLSATTLAVAALPDEFPMVFTFFLGVGVYRLAKIHALVRRAVSVENIGRVTCICTDKTGTITEGRFHIAKLILAKKINETELILAAALSSRSESGDPLDRAILERAMDQSLPLEKSIRVYPFTEERKRESAVYSLADAKFVTTKGAPETIFNVCQMTEEEKFSWRKEVNDLAEQGYKVIASARRIVNGDVGEIISEPEEGYQFLGLITFEDPPRKEVFHAIEICQKNKIHVLMITGDHPGTAKKIAADVGLGGGMPNVVTAQEIDAALKTQNASFLHHIDVIARAIPLQKFAIVNALRTLGDIVAVTGDGVNDVPALRAADVGIAMGERGTQSAREAAAIVLLDDNFGSIVNAISEGKQLFKNMQLSFKYLLSVHMPYVFSATIVPLMGFPLLFYPIHIVWVELFIHPTCMLVFQNLPTSESKALPQKPGQQKISFFHYYDWWAMGLLGIYTTLLAVMTFIVSLYLTDDNMIARANAFTSIGLTHIALTAGLSHLKTLTAWTIVIISFLMLLFLVQIPFVAHYFMMQPPSIFIWMILSMFSVVTLFAAYKMS